MSYRPPKRRRFRKFPPTKGTLRGTLSTRLKNAMKRALRLLLKRKGLEMLHPKRIIDRRGRKPRKR